MTLLAIHNTAANLAGRRIKQTGSVDAPTKAVGVWLALGPAAYVFLVRREYGPRAVAAATRPA